MSIVSRPLSVAACLIAVAGGCAAVIDSLGGLTPIYRIQGSGARSPLAGRNVTTQGVVTKVNNNGFFMQDESGDGDAATSDGIFVYTGRTPTALVGERVQVAALVAEYPVGRSDAALARPLTELTGASVSVLASGITLAATRIPFPPDAADELERYEGMLVQIEGPLRVVQNHFLGRYGQLTLAVGGRLEKPTNRHPAGSAAALAKAADNARRRLLLDDGTSVQHPDPTPYLDADETLRAGDTLAGVTGVIDYGPAGGNGAGGYRIHPTVAPVFRQDNPRRAAPAVGGDIRIAGFNLLNYFTTRDESASTGCFPSHTRSDCRGADSAAEFARRQAKLVAAILALDAAVVGLTEIENNGDRAVLDLVAALNAAAGAGTYASVAPPRGGSGGDAIRVAMIYQPGKLRALGDALGDPDPIHQRAPLLQTFIVGSGAPFSVVVAHFKSKSACPPAGDEVNADRGDGQGCWNRQRVEQARALRAFVAAKAAAEVLVIGDLNAYGKEDPILDFTAHGYVDLIARFDDFGYSYVFDGEAGYLDHALATPRLAARIVGATHWHINADEPSIIDYNTEFRQPACPTCAPDRYAATPYRSSDHDPVVVGLRDY